MRKQEFLSRLRTGLAGLPQEDIAEHLAFYSEMIDDQVEEGVSEEAAVAAAGSVEEIIAQIVSQIPLSKIAKERIKPKRRLSTGEIVLLALGSPIWFSLIIAAFAIILSLYITVWSVIISLWAVFASFVACAFGCAVAGIVLAVGGNGASGLAILAAAIVLAGLSIFSFYGCKTATTGTAIGTKKLAVWIRNCFIKKEEV